MDSRKLTIKSQETVAAAQDMARRRGNPEVTPDHLLLALLDQDLFADWQRLRAEAERHVDALPSVLGGRSSRTPRRRSRACSTRPTTTQRLEDDYVSIEHLFLALEPSPATRSSVDQEIRGVGA